MATNVLYLILHGGNECDCLRCPLPLPWCPRNATVEIYNFLIGCLLPKRKCLGALALSKTKHTGLILKEADALYPYKKYSLPLLVLCLNTYDSLGGP